MDRSDLKEVPHQTMQPMLPVRILNILGLIALLVQIAVPMPKRHNGDRRRA